MDRQTGQSTLIVSVSGIRGIVGESLTPTVVTEFAAAYGSGLAGQPVLVCRDGRATGELYRNAAIAGLLSVGCAARDLGIASTPTCGFFVKASGAAGAIQISASHNPPEWNGLKLFRREGFVLSPSAGQEVADRYRAKDFRLVPFDRIGSLEWVADPHQPHLDRVLSLVDVDRIRARRFRVVLDANHGSGGTFGPRLLEALGCQFDVMGGVPDGQFEHPPEPLEANLTGLCAAVRRAGADVGFAVDPDADRLALVDEQGIYLGEEYTLALAIRHRTRQAKGTVVLNGSTSRVSEDAAASAGCKVVRTPVGEVHVAERMLRENAVIGGEGNGGVIDPRVGMGRDSAIGMALILDMLADDKASLGAIADTLPAYAIRKDKFPMDRSRLSAALDRVAQQFADGSIDRADGIRIDWPDRWVQLRASNTEPIVRVIAEARTSELAAQLCQSVGNLLES